MSAGPRLKLGFVPLTDSAPLVAAQARGVFADEGLEVSLSRETSWATVRDKLAVGALDGAHMLAPAAVAATLGAAGDPTPIVAPFALNLSGAAITLSARLAEASVDADPSAGLARLVARRRAQGASPLTFAVVFPYSLHNFFLRGWLAAAGVELDADVRITVAPPSRMAELLAQGVIEGFCAGEPWNARAVEEGSGRVVARSAEVLGAAPDKVFAVAEAWAEAQPEAMGAVLRALQRSATWCAAPENHGALASLLATPEHVGVERGLIVAGLGGAGLQGAGRPRNEHALWIVEQMQRWGQIGPTAAARVAARVYRPDLYDAALPG